MSKQFDLEQGIMRTWGIVEDLKLLADVISNTEMKVEDQDRLMNLTLGLAELADVRHDALFKTFEAYLLEVANNKTGRKQGIDTF